MRLNGQLNRLLDSSASSGMLGNNRQRMTSILGRRNQSPTIFDLSQLALPVQESIDNYIIRLPNSPQLLIGQFSRLGNDRKKSETNGVDSRSTESIANDLKLFPPTLLGQYSIALF